MSWKDLIFESEPEKPQEHPKHVTLVPNPGRTPITTYGPIPSSVTPVSESPIYQRLRDKTLFEETEPGKILNEYLTPLLAIPMQDRDRYKAALAQAQAHEHLSVGAVLGAIDALKATLADEQKVFDASIEEAKKSGINEKAAQQESLLRQITSLTAQSKQLESEISTAQTKITRAQQDFQAAIATRGAELEAQKIRYTDLLK